MNPVSLMSVAQIATVLRARWRLALITAIAVIAFVTIVSLMVTPRYMSTAAVVLDVKSPDPVAGIVLPGLAGQTYMSTQLGVFQSERVARLAQVTLGLDKNADYYAAWKDSTQGKGDYRTWLSDRIARRMDVTAGPASGASSSSSASTASNVITVNYANRDPKFAADVANAYVKAYIDTTLELRTEPAKQYNAMFDAQSKELRDVLESTQAKLSKYQQEKGIVDDPSAQRVDLETQRLTELSTQLVGLQAMVNESSSRQGQSALNAGQMPEVLSNAVISGLKADYAREQAKLDELTLRYGPSYPDVERQSARVGQLRSQIGGETARVSASLGVNKQVNLDRLATLQQQVDDQRAKLIRLKTQRDDLFVLQHDVDNAQKAFDSVASRANMAGVESQTTQTNVSIIRVATPAAVPAFPKFFLNVVVSIVIGVLLGIVASLTREAFDRRLRSNSDVAQLLHQPLLGVLKDYRPRPSLRSRSMVKYLALGRGNAAKPVLGQ